MQGAMYHVQQQFVSRAPAKLSRRAGSGLGTSDDITLDLIAVPVQEKTEYVGRLIMIEITPVQILDRCIVDDRQAN